MGDSSRRFRAGSSVDDLCRACKTLRRHTVVAATGDGVIVRVVCDYCGSQHNFRGGGPPERATEPSRAAIPFGIVSPRERSVPIVTPEVPGTPAADLELLLRRVIREEAGITPVAPADKWRGGEMVLRPGKPGLQEKAWPIETLFHKIVMIRNRLRVLEQQINQSEMADDQKLKLQAYITGCYGSLTTFNVLFAEEDDRFQGSEGKE